MTDQNKRVAYKCQWCGESFHQVTNERSMRPVPIYVNPRGLQFDTPYCREMFARGEKGEK